MAHGKRMDNCEKIKRLLRKNRKGITIKKISRRLNIHPSTVYRHLNHLVHTGEASYERGIAYLREELKKTGFRALVKKVGFLERRSKEKIERRITVLVMLEDYWIKRKKIDGLERTPDIVLKGIREELKLLRKRLDQSHS